MHKPDEPLFLAKRKDCPWGVGPPCWHYIVGGARCCIMRMFGSFCCLCFRHSWRLTSHRKASLARWWGSLISGVASTDAKVSPLLFLLARRRSVSRLTTGIRPLYPLSYLTACRAGAPWCREPGAPLLSRCLYRPTLRCRPWHAALGRLEGNPRAKNRAIRVTGGRDRLGFGSLRWFRH